MKYEIRVIIEVFKNPDSNDNIVRVADTVSTVLHADENPVITTMSVEGGGRWNCVWLGSDAVARIVKNIIQNPS